MGLDPSEETVSRLAREWAEANGVLAQYQEAPGYTAITLGEAQDAAEVIEDRATLLQGMGVDPERWDDLAAEAPASFADVPPPGST